MNKQQQVPTLAAEYEPVETTAVTGCWPVNPSKV